MNWDFGTTFLKRVDYASRVFAKSKKYGNVYSVSVVVLLFFSVLSRDGEIFRVPKVLFIHRITRIDFSSLRKLFLRTKFLLPKTDIIVSISLVFFPMLMDGIVIVPCLLFLLDSFTSPWVPFPVEGCRLTWRSRWWWPMIPGPGLCRALTQICPEICWVFTCAVVISSTWTHTS